MLGAAPIVISVEKIEKVSFTDYMRNTGSDCLLREWPRSRLKYSARNLSIPTSRPVIAGLFFHEFLKDITGVYGPAVQDGVRKIRTLYKNKVNVYRSRYASSLTSGFDYWPEMSAILKTVIQIYKRDLKSGHHIRREVRIESPAERIYGIVDEVVRSGSEIVLREYKATRDMTNLTQEQYIDQLHFYAILIRAKYGQSPKEMHLEGLLGLACQIELEEERISRIENEISAFLTRTDSAFKNSEKVTSYCVVSQVNCQGCMRKMSCPEVLFGDHHVSLEHGNDVTLVRVTDINHEESSLIVDVIGGTLPISDNTKVDLSLSSLSSSEFVVGRLTIISHMLDSGRALVAGQRSKALFLGGPQ